MFQPTHALMEVLYDQFRISQDLYDTSHGNVGDESPTNLSQFNLVNCIQDAGDAENVSFQYFAEVVTALQTQLIRTQQLLVSEQVRRIHLMEYFQSQKGGAATADAFIETMTQKEMLTAMEMEPETLEAFVADLEIGGDFLETISEEDETEFVDDRSRIEHFEKIKNAACRPKVAMIQEELHFQILSDMQERIDALQELLAHKDAEIERLNADMDEPRGSMMTQVAEIRRLQKTITAKETEAERYRRDVMTLQDRNGSLERALASKNTDIDNLMNENNLQAVEIQRLQEEITLKETQAEHYMRTIATLKDPNNMLALLTKQVVDTERVMPNVSRSDRGPVTSHLQSLSRFGRSRGRIEPEVTVTIEGAGDGIGVGKFY